MSGKQVQKCCTWCNARAKISIALGQCHWPMWRECILYLKNISTEHSYNADGYRRLSTDVWSLWGVERWRCNPDREVICVPPSTGVPGGPGGDLWGDLVILVHNLILPSLWFKSRANLIQFDAMISVWQADHCTWRGIIWGDLWVWKYLWQVCGFDWLKSLCSVGQGTLLHTHDHCDNHVYGCGGDVGLWWCMVFRMYIVYDQIVNTRLLPWRHQACPFRETLSKILFESPS